MDYLKQILIPTMVQRSNVMVKVMEEVLIKLSLMKLVQILLILSKEIDNVKSTDNVVINTANSVKHKDNPVTNR